MYIVLNTSGDTLSTSVRGVYRVWKCCYANILHTYFPENTRKVIILKKAAVSAF